HESPHSARSDVSAISGRVLRRHVLPDVGQLRQRVFQDQLVNGLPRRLQRDPRHLGPARPSLDGLLLQWLQIRVRYRLRLSNNSGRPRPHAAFGASNRAPLAAISTDLALWTSGQVALLATSPRSFLPHSYPRPRIGVLFALRRRRSPRDILAMT